MIAIFRLFSISSILLRHVVNRRVLPKRTKTLRALSYLNPYSYQKNKPRGEAIRISLEQLGPIYVKFGQLLSTRFDLVPEDILIELEKLQDRVPPFCSALAIKKIEQAFGRNIADIYATFEEKPLASASIAQVHAATLKTGEDVVVKIIRPHIEKVIHQDIAVLKLIAKLMERFWRHGKRLRAVAVVNEFEKTTFDELDLMREAANASQLRRNFSDSKMMYVPKIYWGYTRDRLMTMERIYGVQISDMDAFKKNNVNVKKLAEYGVEIFFTQVFRDAFFHADMHPGNLFVDISDPENPRYLGIDFGIMGTLSPVDQNYLAENILAFLSRDYRRVAELHIDSGWVNINTRIDEFESAIRTVCEPIFEKPLSEISFGNLLLKLFQTAERFDMTVQPQLMLLQKTLFYIESLGRKLYPDLDLWETAKPFMTKWMRQQRSPRKLLKLFFKDFQGNTEKLIQLPGILFKILTETRPGGCV
ncbi:MAG: ubiquinone biosynthesis regulatory protein kinase UbiB [Gammaproteobacteria bacterium]|nr:ubiquinone biosynthesis regulatory protein kinase UbiB [Gammaproteobacteria bacterium]